MLIKQVQSQVNIAKEFILSKQTLSDHAKNKEILSGVDQLCCKDKKKMTGKDSTCSCGYAEC